MIDPLGRLKPVFNKLFFKRDHLAHHFEYGNMIYNLFCLYFDLI